MSARVVMALAVTLAFVFPAIAQPEKPATAKQLLKLLKESEVKLTNAEIKDAPLIEVLGQLSKQHKIPFVIMEEQFRARKVEDIRTKKSSRQDFDPKGMSVSVFLDSWLPTLRATHRVRADWVEISPLVGTVTAAGDPLSALIEKLHGQDVTLEGNISEIPLFELLQRLAKTHELTFVINQESFKAVGLPDIKDATPRLNTTQLRGLTLHHFLTTILDSMGATYMIRGKTIEIVAPVHAARLTKTAIHENEQGLPSLQEPLVSAVIKNESLNDTVNALAERYDLSVVVSPQAGDGRTAAVSARLVNVPADKALELLAVQADLRLVRTGAAYLITSREQADALFREKLEKDRAQREASRSPQGSPPSPAPKTQPK